MVSSLPIMVDTSSPQPGSVSVYVVQEQLAAVEDIIIQWTAFQDRESGILLYELGIGSHEYSQDVYSFRPVSGFIDFIDGKDIMSDGRNYFVQIKVSWRPHICGLNKFALYSMNGAC